MILLDTHVVIFAALTPERLSAAALTAIERDFNRHELVCADISLWEVAMLITKGRLATTTQPEAFIGDLLLARRIRVLPITAVIAGLAQAQDFAHGDPADRLIAATARQHRCRLVTGAAACALFLVLSPFGNVARLGIDKESFTRLDNCLAYHSGVANKARVRLIKALNAADWSP